MEKSIEYLHFLTTDMFLDLNFNEGDTCLPESVSGKDTMVDRENNDQVVHLFVDSNYGNKEHSRHTRIPPHKPECKMNYIGSKFTLLDFLWDKITWQWEQITGIKYDRGRELSNVIFADIFSGTGIVARLFKHYCAKVITNDMEYYSYVFNRTYVQISGPVNCSVKIEELNELAGVDGFIAKEYSSGGKPEPYVSQGKNKLTSESRKYFSRNNGKKIDAIRQKIEEWHDNGRINDDKYHYLICVLLEAADKVANTASVYGAFLKKFKKTARQPLRLVPIDIFPNNGPNHVYRGDSCKLAKHISGHICYIDTPYNSREYGAYYHLLNTIAEYKPFKPKGKTGQREYSKSVFCKKAQVLSSFENLIRDLSTRFKLICVSYNNEGLMTLKDIEKVMSRYGNYQMRQSEYKRYDAKRKYDNTADTARIL